MPSKTSSGSDTLAAGEVLNSCFKDEPFRARLELDRVSFEALDSNDSEELRDGKPGRRGRGFGARWMDLRGEAVAGENGRSRGGGDAEDGVWAGERFNHIFNAVVALDYLKMGGLCIMKPAGASAAREMFLLDERWILGNARPNSYEVGQSYSVLRKRGLHTLYGE